MGKQRVVEAVNHLINAPNYASLINEMTRVIETWDTQPMVYSGYHAVLNAMIDVGLKGRAAFERLVKLIEERRKLVPAVRRTDYQRELMQQRRAREAKALELHELREGRLHGARRAQALADLRARWAEERAEFIEAKGELSWKERNAAAGEFWEMIDRNLDINLQDARRRRA